MHVSGKGHFQLGQVGSLRVKELLEYFVCIHIWLHIISKVFRLLGFEYLQLRRLAIWVAVFPRFLKEEFPLRVV